MASRFTASYATKLLNMDFAFGVIYQSFLPASVSPNRLVDQLGRSISWANDSLGAQRLRRQLSLRSLKP